VGIPQVDIQKALESLEAIAKLHSEPNLCFFRWLRFFAKCLWPRGYVTLQKIEPTKKSSNFAREASFAIPSLDKAICEASHPAIIPRIYAQRFGERSVLTIEVSAGMSKPYFRKSEGMDRGTYIRIGRNTMRATPEMIEELQWQSRGIDFETLPQYRSSKEDLDLAAFQLFLDTRKNHAHTEANDSMLRAYHLLVSEHAKLVPTHAGLLLFGKHPQQFLPEAMIICSHFEGITGRNTIATVDCEGTLFN